MTNRVQLLDLKAERAKLKPFLEQDGGVVHVAASDTGPVSIFAKTIRRWMIEDSWPRRWNVVQIDPDNPSTHYVVGIVKQLEHALGLLSGRAAARPTAVIGDRVKAQSVSFNNVSIEIPGESDLAAADRLDGRIQRIGEEVRARSREERLALICVNAHRTTAAGRATFMTTLWDPMLAPLVDAGLLLICIGDLEQVKGGDWPPSASKAFRLPGRLDGDAAAAACEDIAGVLLAERVLVNANDARVAAETLCTLSENDVADLHANLTKMLLRDEAPDEEGAAT